MNLTIHLIYKCLFLLTQFVVYLCNILNRTHFVLEKEIRIHSFMPIVFKDANMKRCKKIAVVMVTFITVMCLSITAAITRMLIFSFGNLSGHSRKDNSLQIN